MFPTWAASSELHWGVKLGDNHNNPKKERTLRCKLTNRPLVMKYLTWSPIYIGFYHFETDTFWNDSTSAVGVSLPCLHKTGNSKFVASTAAQCSPWKLPVTSRTGNGLGGSWAVRAMGLKKTQTNPQKTTPLQEDSVSTRLNRLNHLRSTLPLFHYSSVCFKAQESQNPLPCPPLRCNSLLSLFGQGEEEEWSPGWVWQLMLLLWGEINCKLDCAPSSEFSLIYGILPLFTHSKGSYNFNSLKPAILTPKQALTELPEGKVGLEIFLTMYF